MTSRADPDSLRLPSVQEIDFLDIPAVLEKVMDKASREVRASGVIFDPLGVGMEPDVGRSTGWYPSFDHSHG